MPVFHELLQLLVGVLKEGSFVGVLSQRTFPLLGHNRREPESKGNFGHGAQVANCP